VATEVFDGHNDLLLKLWRGDAPVHLDLGRAAGDGFAGGFFALYVPGPSRGDPPDVPYALPLAEPLEPAEAARVADELATILLGLEADGALRVVRSADDLDGSGVRAIMHLEGADPLDPDLSSLQAWYERGLRSIGLVWSRPNAFAEGVPFRFPGSPDTGPGLTEAGRDLVRACNRLGILVDCSHLNRAGFLDVAALSAAPLVATHSNAWSLCPASRNLQDDQLDAIAASDGVVGVNFAVSFLREDGSQEPETPISEIVRHVDYLAERMGVEHVALGSDFEGAVVPAALEGSAGLQRLVEALRVAGHDEAAARAICFGNWRRVLRETWS
jgi:membrane dipeptidase